MPGDQKVFVRVSQNTPEPQLLTPKQLGKGKYKRSLCFRYFVRACVCALPIKQIKESKVACTRLLHRRWMESLWWDFPLSPEAGGPACPPPAKLSPLPPNSSCATWFQIQHTGYYSPLAEPISLTNDRKEMWLKTREHISFFISSWIALGTVFLFKLKWVKLQCPLFATHRSLLNQMFLIL